MCKDFEIKNLSEYHDLYLKYNLLLLADLFKNFFLFLEIYELDPTRFLSDQGLAWRKTFKKNKVKLELLIDIDMLLVVQKETSREYVTLLIDMR